MQLYDQKMRKVKHLPGLLTRLRAALEASRLAPALVPPRVRRKERGQAVVETVIVIGVFLMLILGLACVGQILLANYTVNQAARAAAHQAAIEGDEPDSAKIAAESAINAGVGMEYSSESTTITVTCRKPSSDPTEPGPQVSVCRRYYPISVRITYTDEFWVQMPPLFTGFTVQGVATRAAERDQQ
jgi:Flp pilus assembly protein TadG